MGEIVDVGNRDGLTILSIDNPLVSALSAALRRVPLECFEVVSRDPQVEAVVIACSGRTSISGADVREFGRAFEPLSLDSVALGGGLEVAISCHFRIASKDARLGQLEVELRLTPGGGTQRLPRATGLERAVQLIASGERIGVGEALGLIDEAVPDDLASSGLTFARKITAERRVLRCPRDDDCEWAMARANRRRFTEVVPAANKRDRGLDARARKPIAAA